MARGRFLQKIPYPARLEQTLDAALDKAIEIQRPAVVAYVERIRAKHPQMAPAQVVAQLEQHYRYAVMGIGAASGAAAAVPGTGTVATLATGAAEIGAFVSASAMYVLALAELHGLPIGDPQLRRALVLSVLVGEGGAAIVAGERDGSAHWAKVLGRNASNDRLGGLNSRLGKLMLTRYGTRQGALLLGRALPLGIGAGVGAVGNVALARMTIASARKAFGPAPRRFPARVVDA